MIKRILLTIFITSLTYYNLTAQVTTAGITGTVTDENLMAIAGVSVSAINRLSIIKYSSVTSLDGVFKLPGMKPGIQYTITLSAIGYENYVLKNVTFLSGQQLKLKVEMTPEVLSFKIISTASKPIPTPKLSTDTSFVYTNGENQILCLFSDHTYRTKTSWWGIWGANGPMGRMNCMSTGKYKLSGDSLFLEDIQYFNRPITMVIDTFQENKPVSLLSINKNKILTKTTLNFSKGKAFIEGLPVGVSDTFNIRNDGDQNAENPLYCHATYLDEKVEPLTNFTYYLPFSAGEELAIKFYQPRLKIKKVYTFAFKVSGERIVYHNKNVAPDSLVMLLVTKDKSIH